MSQPPSDPRTPLLIDDIWDRAPGLNFENEGAVEIRQAFSDFSEIRIFQPLSSTAHYRALGVERLPARYRIQRVIARLHLPMNS